MATCQCGCPAVVAGEGWFAPGHDSTVIGVLVRTFGSVAVMARLFGFGPGGRNAQEEFRALLEETG